MKTKTSYICLPIVVSVLILLSLGSCKDFGIPDYKLTIDVKSGVDGTPPSGVSAHKELDSVDYKYTAQNTQYQVEVLVNGARRLSEGQWVMYTDLDVVAQVFDIRGAWDFTLAATSDSTVEKREFTITFTGGDPLSGNFTDSNGHNGTWVIDAAKLTITYGNWLDYTLTSDSALTMSGAWSGEGKTSSWSASRVL
ncbi:MAG: hypothetical protein NT166_26155 [Candidatus Aminicenantes bacterium]|nr:hypothetical protein [Candidatus Aminicenantes bacterium]